MFGHRRARLLCRHAVRLRSRSGPVPTFGSTGLRVSVRTWQFQMSIAWLRGLPLSSACTRPMSVHTTGPISWSNGNPAVRVVGVTWLLAWVHHELHRGSTMNYSLEVTTKAFRITFDSEHADSTDGCSSLEDYRARFLAIFVRTGILCQSYQTERDSFIWLLKP